MITRSRVAAAAVAGLLAAADRANAQSVQMPELLEQLGIESWWDVVQFQPWTGSLGLAFDDQERRLAAPQAPRERSRTRLATETVTLRNDGIAILDRRLFTGALALGVQYAQGHRDTADAEASDRARLANHSFTGTFLPERPYTATIGSVRNQGRNVLPSGTTTESDHRGSSIQLFLRENNILRDKEWLPYFSGNVRAAEERERQTTTSGTQVFRQDDRRRSATVGLQNGGETSDMSLQYQRVKLDNFAYGPGSYASHSANAYYSFDFGAGLSRRLDSRLNWHDRAGATPDSSQRTLEVSEFLTVAHNVFRTSTYSYLLNRQETFYGVATTHAAAAQLDQQVYNNLAATGAVNGSRSTLPGGRITGAGASAGLDYSRNLPGDGLLRLTLGGGYARSSTEVPGGTIPVVDEPYAVPAEVGAGSAILLKNRNVEARTIVVVVLKGGARVPAFEGIDYAVRVDGDRTSLVPNPASAVMLPGDPLNVSYSYAIAPGSTFATTSRSGTMGLTWRWIAITASHDQADQSSLSGGSDLLVDSRRDFGQVFVHHEWGSLSARAGASATDFDSTRLAYREHRLEQYLSYAPMYGFSITFSGNRYRTTYRLPPQEARGASYRADLQWNHWGWLTSAYLSRRTFDDTRQPRELVDEAGLRIRKSWTKLDLSLAFGAQRRSRGDVSSRNAYFHVGAVRRF